MRCILLGFICLALISCGRQKTDSPSPHIPQESSAEPVFVPANFLLNTALLSDSVNLADLSLRVPAGWMPLEEKKFRTMLIGAENDTGSFRHEPVAAFTRDPSCRMLVSRIPLSHPAAEEFIWWAREMEQVFRTVSRNSNTSESWLIFDGIRALLLYSRDSAMIHYKLVLETSPPTAIDYTFPVKFSELLELGVNSSMASIRFNAPAG